jgi:hypothetical protein
MALNRAGLPATERAAPYFWAPRLPEIDRDTVRAKELRPEVRVTLRL